MRSNDNFPDAGDVPGVAIFLTLPANLLLHTILREGTSSERQIVNFKLTGGKFVSGVRNPAAGLCVIIGQ